MRRWVVLVLLCLAIGCGRAWYRRDADRETYSALEERNTDPQWHAPYFSLNPNPASRLFDPYDPDYPAMPPDDPAANVYMDRVNGMRNYRRWHKDGDAPTIENPEWRSYLPLDEKGTLVLTRERAVELAWLNSRDYQTALENLYRQALTLTLDRFAFAMHWFGSNFTNFVGVGDGDTATHTLSTSSSVGFNRMLAAGGQLLVDFANSFVFNFNGAGSTSMTSTLTFNLIQPLIRGFGRRVVLEHLTQSERNVLYAVRSFARFRKNLYVSITTRGGGFLTLLLQVQNIRNQEASVVSRERNVRLQQANYEADRASVVDVDQAFIDLQNARLSLLQARTSLETAFDNFKITLGLPPDIPIRLDDSLLAPFQLTDPALEKVRDEMEVFFAEYRELDQAPPLAKLQEGFQRLKDLRASVLKTVDQVQAEIERWQKQHPSPREDEQETQRLRAVRKALAKQIPELRDDLQELAKDIDQAMPKLREDKRKEAWESLLELTRRLTDTSAELFVLQNQVRVYLIQLQPIDIALDAAVQYARTHRLDLMNQRAQVVDAWRQIAVTANALKSDLNLNASAILATPPGSLNPVGFSPTANTYSFGVQFNAPLNRKLERNTYRQSLINYQVARRAYMILDDEIESSIRRDLRQLETDRLSFEITRRSLQAAARAVEFAEENQRLVQLQMAGAQDTSGPLKVRQAYDNLLTVKNNLIGNWVSYETDRIQLLLDLESLQLDEREVPDNDADDNQPADFLPPAGQSTPGAHATGLAPDATGLVPGDQTRLAPRQAVP
jgi:outer membrane protein TolC